MVTFPAMRESILWWRAKLLLKTIFRKNKNKQKTHISMGLFFNYLSKLTTLVSLHCTIRSLQPHLSPSLAASVLAEICDVPRRENVPSLVASKIT